MIASKPKKLYFNKIIGHSVFNLFFLKIFSLTHLCISNTSTSYAPKALSFSSLHTISHKAANSHQPSKFLKNFSSSLSYPQCPNPLPLNLIQSPTTTSRVQSRSISTMADNKKEAVYRRDYTPPSFNVKKIYMDFDLDIENTTVRSKFHFSKTNDSEVDMILDGENMCLKEISVNDVAIVEGNDYEVTSNKLKIFASALPSNKSEATVKTTVTINPKENLKLTGLFASGEMLCTQCEAQGFRRITYFMDRPDVMTTYTVSLTGDKTTFPVLLSNGNKIKYSEDGTKHTAVFNDPFPKPSYLFAIVAGKLACLPSNFTTMSGKNVKLQIFSEPFNIDKLEWAMESLKQAMKWDEDTFGLEYDLDEFNIVGVQDFNMGAMENKGLNIFNTAALVCKPNLSLDAQFSQVRATVAHEYFHNWTGNRVTCRDWFQLTLKEGLTVYRHQAFNYKVANPATERLHDVFVMRTHQSAEDSGPMAHPIRPDSYVSIENFYTLTVYYKGAEIIRMYETILGVEGFRKGMDLYFQRHDGQAVTCDDFRAAMSDANGVDLTHFGAWYSQKGTPSLYVKSEEYDNQNETYTITFQQILSHPIDSETQALYIPIKFGLIGKTTHKHLFEPTVLNMTMPVQSFSFSNIKEQPVPSILRGFSAPVNFNHKFSNEDTIILACYDNDVFTKVEAATLLVTQQVFSIMEKFKNNEEAFVDPKFIDTFKTILEKTEEKSLLERVICIPTMNELVNKIEGKIDIDTLYKARQTLRKTLAYNLKDSFLKIYNSTQEFAAKENNYWSLENSATENRSLAVTILSQYINMLDSETANKMCWKHFNEAKCMDDRFYGVRALSICSEEFYDKALESFYEFSKDDPLTLDKWFTLQFSADRPDTITRVKNLVKHKDFNIKNPNRLRVAKSFGMNLFHFHNPDGSGYKILEDLIIEVDKFNPIMSSSLVTMFSNFKRYCDKRQALMTETLQRILNAENTSTEVLELVTNYLK